MRPMFSYLPLCLTLLSIIKQVCSSKEEIRVIVKLTNGKEKTRKNFKEKYSFARNVVDLKTSNLIAMTLSKRNLSELEFDPNIHSITKDYEMHVIEPKKSKNQREYTPWGITAVLQDEEFWKEKFGSQKIKVCIADTGYDLAHEDLPKEEYVKGIDGYGESWSRDVNGHGTHVAGTAAAVGGNDIGVKGVIPDGRNGNFKLVIGKACSSFGGCVLSEIFAAIEGCVLSRNAKIVSMSFGCSNCYNSIEDEFYQNLYDVYGVLFVASAGNSFGKSKDFPAAYPSVLSVAANNEFNERAEFSSINNQVELSAPGTDIMSTIPFDRYRRLDGTSMSAPHVSAVAALVWMHFPTCTNHQIRNALDYTALDIEDDGCDTQTGYGLVQAKTAYEFLLNDGNCGADFDFATRAMGGCNQLRPPCASDVDCEDGDACTLNLCTIETGACVTKFQECGVCGKATVFVDIFTDLFPVENFWEVVDLATEDVIRDGTFGVEQSAFLNDTFCLEDGNYAFTVFDTFGDGICCGNTGNGTYSVFVDDALVAIGDEFDFIETTEFTVSTAIKKKKKKKKGKKKKKKV